MLIQQLLSLFVGEVLAGVGQRVDVAGADVTVVQRIRERVGCVQGAGAVGFFGGGAEGAAGGVGDVVFGERTRSRGEHPDQLRTTGGDPGLEAGDVVQRGGELAVVGGE